MSGFGSGSFGGFGQSNNQQSTGFGGFGANNATSTSTGFGSGTATNSAFGSTNNTNTSGGLFGNTTGAFGGGGTSSSGFGSNTNTTFGASKPAFGASTSTGGGLFGSNNNNNTNNTTPSSGFGGFGGNATASTSSPFGGSGGNLFGASKPAFGSTTNNTTTATGTTSLFGGNSGTGFGNNAATTGGFGASLNPGIGSNVGDPPGTAITPFQAHQEKETAGAGNQSNAFQNILFQEPYKKWSAEELRLADYAQGRRHGNASGAGAFGVSNFGSTGFGATNQQSAGFGSGASTGGGLFGGANNNTNATTATTTGFGGGSAGGFGSGGGLFGNQPKPATGGLFGGGSTTTSQPAQSGGLFGTSSGGGFGTTNTSSGFGSTNNNATGGLFGSNNTAANQAKPAGFSFGNTGATTGGFGASNTNSAFGSNNTTNNAGTGGGLFGNAGQSNGTGLFGNNQAQSQQQGTGSVFGGGGFGAQNQQQAGSSLFGNQQKPATGGGGLFGGGGTSTTGGLFGAGGAPNNSFGGAGTNNSSGGLFGSKPAATGGLFGSNAASQGTNASGGLFGGMGTNPQAQQAGQSSLFGAAGQNQAKPGLFGTSQPAGNSLFGGQNTQQQGSSFGGNNAQQQHQGSILGGSIMGNTQGINSGPQSLTANITDVSAFGSPSLFSNLSGAETPNPGPLATPLSSKSKPRRSSILPMYKLNPASAARFVTPQKRGFGFSYSTYGTPGGSPSSAASTPGGASRSLLGSSSLNRSLSKSVSTSNLRRSFNAEDSILAPGAFSASSGPRYYGSNGSVKKLIINKDMRSDLFSTPTKDKPSADQLNGSRKLSKRVSFDTSTVEAPEADDVEPINASTPRGVPPQDLTPASNSVNGSKPPTGDSEQVKGKELAIVHEEDVSSQIPAVANDGLDKAPGSYWMSPTKETIAGMTRMQRQRVESFTVGRDNVGSVKFKPEVDLTNIDLDEIFGGIVILETRSATVYPIAAKKPPVGKGLNVPALISLEQSWPRGREKRPGHDVRRVAKHVERLKRIENTTFEEYNPDTGVWKFSVEHFTTYGLDYDEDEEEPEQSDDVLASAKALKNQVKMTQVELTGGIPVTTLHVDTLMSLFHDQDTTSPANAHERLVWELASILFDGPAASADEDLGNESRKSRLSKFWAALVDSASSRSVALARSSEEKAIAALSGHRIQDACKYLLDGNNFRLATLVSLIGSNDQSKKDIREQINEWQDANFLSEFADPLRAIYELLSGNSGVCEGKKAVPLEDRVESFIISQRFGLDWKQAFGLRLWYSISPNDHLSAAVRLFQEDIAQDREQRPQTWYLEQGIPALWNDQHSEAREDLLWGLLKLYSDAETDLEAVLRPENSQLSPLDIRLSWQLSRALLSTHKVSYGQNTSEKADASTIAFADQLVSEGSWLEATFVLLHLGNPDMRAKAVQENLCRHAALLGSETGSNFTTLTQTLKIPPPWIWEAQALYMRAVKKDAAAEVHCLLRAGSYLEAHNVLVHQVAPSAVVSRDYDELAVTLSRFEGHDHVIPSWTLGGEVYKAFLELVGRRKQRQQISMQVLDRLLSGLPALRETTVLSLFLPMTPEAFSVAHKNLIALTNTAFPSATLPFGQYKHSHTFLLEPVTPNLTKLGIWSLGNASVIVYESGLIAALAGVDGNLGVPV
ncbi:Nucleoporin [Colletotrichum gloeosporioides]|uniref:Nucleoporin n=1 Tax=Colletotrichum gloeosporioides TaxID=474922 RepID=A0A8H4CDB6_COLGL|nr:Nucleoporin [Colletotrichum gloeosporioides]KAF3801697.1 Nucleoporin [Colletotrichum gloeosporioides]